MGETIRESDINRKEIFLVSKVWIQDAGYEKTMASFEKTLLIWGRTIWIYILFICPTGTITEAGRPWEELLKAGRVKSIGVCNFLPDRLLDLILSHEVTPAVNQIELHPFCQQKELRHLMAQYQIQPMAWAPFAEGQNGIFQNPELAAVGQKYGKTPAQVILRWLRQSKIVSIPKSVHEERIRQNYDVDDFILTEEDMSIIEGMDTGRSLILDVPSLNEVRRLHGIRFEQ